MFCTKCGNEKEEGSLICPKCGTLVSEIGQPQKQTSMAMRILAALAAVAVFLIFMFVFVFR